MRLQTAGHPAAGELELQMSLGAEKGEEHGQQRAGGSVTLLPAALRALSLDQGLPQLFAHTCATEYDLSSPGEGCMQRKGCQGFGHGSVSPSMGTETPSGQGEGLRSLLARLGHVGLDGSCPGSPFLIPSLTYRLHRGLWGRKTSYRTEPSVPMATPREVWSTLCLTIPST